MTSRKGYATEIVTEVHNQASRAVMERLDMTFLKIIHAPGLIEGSSEMRADAPFALYQVTAGELPT